MGREGFHGCIWWKIELAKRVSFWLDEQNEGGALAKRFSTTYSLAHNKEETAAK